MAWTLRDGRETAAVRLGDDTLVEPTSPQARLIERDNATMAAALETDPWAWDLGLSPLAQSDLSLMIVGVATAVHVFDPRPGRWP